MEGSTLSASVFRWLRLTSHRLTDAARPLGLALAVVAGLNLATLLLFRQAVFQGHRAEVWTLFVVIASLISAAGAFRPMHQGRSATDWLLWPATALEKYAAAVAESVVAVPLLLSAAALVTSALLAGAEVLVVGRTSGVWLPWAGFSLGEFGGLLVFLLVLVTGSAAFRRHALWKTGLVLVGGATVFAFLSLLILGFGTGTWSWHREGGHYRWAGDLDVPAARVKPVLDVLASVWYFGVVPVFCLGYGWAKVREKEARDEVQ